jgi:toxin secretion/phage lysis holin
MCLFFVWKNITYMQYIRLEDVNVYDVLKKLGIAFGGSVITYAFGGWSDALGLLAMLTIFDYITGVSASIYERMKNPNDPTKGLNSNKGFWGIFKKFLMFMVIAVMYRFDMLLGLTGNLGFMIGAVYFYMLNELISLVENLGRMDVKMPAQVKMIIGVLNTKSNTAPDIAKENDESTPSTPTLTVVPDPEVNNNEETTA